MPKTIKIAGASGYWGDWEGATAQLLKVEGLDVLTYDYLAEITMSILARARAADPDAGFATDFVSAALAPNLKQIAARGVKVISNAGGLNPPACAEAVRAAAKAAGVELKVGVVTGDDLSARGAELAGHREMFTGAPFPPAARVASVNAYLGAAPIAAALDAGADIVITGRCADSAMALGACLHAFGWARDDYDRLAAGSLAGHVLECGAQATGGNFTDWADVPDIDVIGYPVAEVSEDGSFVLAKPSGTGGLVSRETVAEQLVYEIADPQAYVLPDVVCDFADVTIAPAGENRVRVAGAKGRAPTASYKASATYLDGFRAGLVLTFYGAGSEEKACVYAEAALRRAQETLAARGMGPFCETSVEILGAESQYGSARVLTAPREVALKLAAKHESAPGAGALLRAATSLGLSGPPGLSGFQGGRPKPSPVVRLFSFLIGKAEVEAQVLVEGREIMIETRPPPGAAAAPERPAPPAAPALGEGAVAVALFKLAVARSGDKGDSANVGVIARKPAYLPYIWAALDEVAVAARFAHFLEGPVERFFMPGPQAINYVLHDALGGGGIASLRNDPQGKGFAQLLLEHPIPVSAAIAAGLG